jgi:deoxyxylulose-5-phosphate synthase
LLGGLEDNSVIAVIGDGSHVGAGMAYEAMNNAGAMTPPSA